jgi:endonuclease/exonuclease/phosphatase family metal-dependent hydrolase
MRKGFTLAMAILAIAVLEYREAALAKEKHTTPTVTVANLNIFHGIDCAAILGDKTQCRLADRIDLLFEHLAALGCPDIVTLQEVLDRDTVTILSPQGPLELHDLTSALALITAKLKPFAETCGFAYAFLYAADLIDPQQGPLFQRTDEELILSRYPIQQQEVRLLHSALYVPGEPTLHFFARHVLFARIKHPVGPLDVFTTHLAASEDFGDNPCNSEVTFPPALFPPDGLQFTVSCPAECAPSQTVRECEARQVANFVKEHHHGPRPVFITGDFNARPGSNAYLEFTGRGWLDSHLEAGNQECDGGLPLGSGSGCTAGRDAVGGDLENPDLNVEERIDYLFVVPSAPEFACQLQEQGTGLFADQPNPFADEQCGPSGPICWASDHNGTRARLSCARGADEDFSLAAW